MEFPGALDDGPVNYAPKNPGVTAYGFAAIRPNHQIIVNVCEIDFIHQTNYCQAEKNMILPPDR